MTVHYSHPVFRQKRNSGGYCEKCERDTPHRNLVCFICKSTMIGSQGKTFGAFLRRKMQKAAAARTNYHGAQLYYSGLEKRIRIDRRNASKESAEKFRAMFEEKSPGS